MLSHQEGSCYLDGEASPIIGQLPGEWRNAFHVPILMYILMTILQISHADDNQLARKLANTWMQDSKVHT